MIVTKFTSSLRKFNEIGAKKLQAYLT